MRRAESQLQKPCLSGAGTLAADSTLIAANKRTAALPTNLPPRGLSRREVAAYVGVSPTTFDRLVEDRVMPQPVRMYGRIIWDRKRVDAAFDAIDRAEDGDDVPWNQMRT